MELSKNFEPASIEKKWTEHWKEHRYFNSKPDNRKPYTIVIPPPNVTGVLHMGHTLNETVQDILIRKARTSGFNACWVPGSDHASIATEAKVVQMLKEKNIDKNKLSREEFLRYAFEWKEKYGSIIYNQIERLGCSVDWDRVTFTMDDHYYKAVVKVFVDLFQKGLIYRGAGMINWDPAAKTALSDEEVEYKELQGTLYYVKYAVAGSTDEFVTIATQRPETIMGDTAVCVNPNDQRFQHLKGKQIIIPLVNRSVPLIFDSYVDPEFGTGALKVTPAHDINDYNLGIKYNLPIIDTLNEDGTLSAAAKVFVGLDRFAARKKVAEQLKSEGLLVKQEEYTTRLGYSQRTNAVVEPRISTQWFVQMKELAAKALNEVLSGRTTIHPEERFIATYKYWLENVKDWCISRQLWWGQRIPAWYDEKGNLYVANSLEELRQQKPETKELKLSQDEDVLDTWFSSWIWPIEVFNGITKPDNEEINYYYPTSVLVTGQDIIFFWVARMIMAGMEYKNQTPFADVYFTGMVRDKQGRKMSKSLGNSPDLLDLIDRFGADAVRFGIMISSPADNDLLFDDSSCEQGRFFDNKLWNALKLVKMWEGRTDGTGNGESGFAVDWFDSRLNQVKKEVEKAYTKFRLSEALKTIYSLIWDDFCSWYLEWIKPGFEQPISEAIYSKTIYFFEELMALLHPFMPFITEEIYHNLKTRVDGDDLTIRQYNLPGDGELSILSDGEMIKKRISDIRDVRQKFSLKNKDLIGLKVITGDYDLYTKAGPIIMKQTFSDSIEQIAQAEQDMVCINSEKDIIYIDIKSQNGGSTSSEQKEIQRAELEKDLAYQKGFLASVEKKLTNERFMQNAKPEVIEIERKKKADAEAKIAAIRESLGG